MIRRAASYGSWPVAAAALLPLMFAMALIAAGLARSEDETGDRVAGKELALKVCSKCHLVAAEQLLDPLVGAPPFHEVAARPTTTELSLRVFFRTPHQEMPNLMLTPQETDDIIAYILSLK